MVETRYRDCSAHQVQGSFGSCPDDCLLWGHSCVRLAIHLHAARRYPSILLRSTYADSIPRNLTRPVHVGNVTIGGGAPVVVQSMTCTPTVDLGATLEQVTKLAEAGCDVVRVSVPTKEALGSFHDICRESPVPIVADIHFDYRLALGALDAGAAKLRINPGNIGSWEKSMQ